jgi:hypothetical protein
MVHFCGLFFGLIALLKLCAAAALNVINADKGTYSVINEDYIIDNRLGADRVSVVFIACFCLSPGFVETKISAGGPS